MLTNLDKAPFPWFGGKSQAADLVWSLLGDVTHYIEPFFGGGAVLLNRRHPANRAYYSETINDLDGFVVSFWRAVQWDPVTVAMAASWPVTEADKSSRQLALLRWRDQAVARLAGDAAWYDPIMAGWWAYAVSCQIGVFDGRQAWTADPVTGKIYKQPLGVTREPGVWRDRPHVNDHGVGINKQTAREPGVWRDRPHVSNDGLGVNHAGAREPGVWRSRPHLGNHGVGINKHTAREPGISRDRPHVSNDGLGVNHAGAREPGVLDPITPDHGVSALDDWGHQYHDLCMPEIIRWLRHLSARLRHVRIVNGDWSRVCTLGAILTLNIRTGSENFAGVFLDPPYSSNANRDIDLYSVDDYEIANAVVDWCLEHGNESNLRIVLAGFESEHGTRLVKAGWTEHKWFKGGHLRGGMGNIGKDGHQQDRERLWSSPHCLDLASDRQLSLFAEDR